MNKLKGVFTTGLSAEFKIRYEGMIKDAYERRDCMTCENYIPIEPSLPGCCTAYPECRLGGLALKTCEKYKADEDKRKMPWGQRGMGGSLATRGVMTGSKEWMEDE